jgi:hypothetical protein
LKKFPNGTAAGPDGIRVAFYQEASLVSPDFVSALVKLCNLIVSGDIIDPIQPYLAGANLSGLFKDEKHIDIRPIAVGCVIRRLVAKMAIKKIKSEIPKYFLPFQTGEGLVSATEVTIHSIRSVISDFQKRKVKDCVLLKIDAMNAFNEIKRKVMLQEVLKIFPQIAKFMVLCYETPSNLFYGDFIIKSQEGTQQGDGLAGLGFDLAIQPLIKQLAQRHPDVKIIFYRDDGKIIGPYKKVNKCWRDLLKCAPLIGYHPKADKSHVYPCSPGFSWKGKATAFKSVTRHDSLEAIILGSPIGSDSFCSSSVENKVKEYGEVVKKLSLIGHSQYEYTLLKYCLSFPKAISLMRSIDPTLSKSGLLKFDSIIRQCFEQIIATPLSDEEWSQCSLSISSGGFGLRSCAAHAPSAFLSSIKSSEDAVKLITGLDLSSTYQIPIQNAIRDFNSKSTIKIDSLSDVVSQKVLSSSIDEFIYRKLVDGSSKLSQRRFQSLDNSNSGKWLLVVPNEHFGTELSSIEFLTAAKFRLGAPLFPEVALCLACDAPMDTRGVHATQCMHGGNRTSRHNAVRDIVYTFASSGRIPVAKETKWLVKDSNRKPADVYLPSFNCGKDVAIDFAVISPFTDEAMKFDDYLPKYAEKKVKKYANDVKLANYDFQPMIADTMGRWDDDAIKVLTKISSAYAKNNCQDFSQVKNQIFQKLSISIQSSNAKAILQRTQLKPVFMDDRVSNFSSKFNSLFDAEKLEFDAFCSAVSSPSSSSVT